MARKAALETELNDTKQNIRTLCESKKRTEEQLFEKAKAIEKL